MYSAGREIVSRRISLRCPTTFHHAEYHRHHQCRYSHRKIFALAGRSFSTALPDLLMSRFLWIAPSIPAIQLFIRRNCSVWNYNSVRLQGPTSTVCGKYCCLYALYMDRGYTPEQFVGLFDTTNAEKQISTMFQSEFEPLNRVPCGGQCSHSMHKRHVTIIASSIP